VFAAENPTRRGSPSASDRTCILKPSLPRYGGQLDRHWPRRPHEELHASRAPHLGRILGYGALPMRGKWLEGREREVTVLRGQYTAEAWADLLKRHGFCDIDSRVLPPPHDEGLGTLLVLARGREETVMCRQEPCRTGGTRQLRTENGDLRAVPQSPPGHLA
jgi:hypothetical protein